MAIFNCNNCEGLFYGTGPIDNLKCGNCRKDSLTVVRPPDVPPDKFHSYVTETLESITWGEDAFKSERVECGNCGDRPAYEQRWMKQVTGVGINACSVDCAVELLSNPLYQGHGNTVESYIELSE